MTKKTPRKRRDGLLQAQYTSKRGLYTMSFGIVMAMFESLLRKNEDFSVTEIRKSVDRDRDVWTYDFLIHCPSLDEYLWLAERKEKAPLLGVWSRVKLFKPIAWDIPVERVIWHMRFF